MVPPDGSYDPSTISISSYIEVFTFFILNDAIGKTVFLVMYLLTGALHCP